MREKFVVVSLREKFEIQTLYVIPCREWNDLVRTHYNIAEYDFWDDNEADRDGIYQFTAKKEKLDEYDLEEMEKWKDGQAMFMTDTILKDLCNQNLIDEGEYLINEIGSYQ